MKRSIPCLVILFLLNSAYAAIPVSLTLTDNVVNPGQLVQFSGTTGENLRVGVLRDQTPYPYQWSPSTGEILQGVFENTLYSSGIKLKFRPDLDIAFIDNATGELCTVDLYGQVWHSGVSAKRVGDMADVDGDGDLDIVFINQNDNLCYIDNAKNVSILPDKALDVGGIADMDGDGDLDIVYISTDGYHLCWMDRSGNKADFFVGSPLSDAGWAGSFNSYNGDGDNWATAIYSPSNYYYIHFQKSGSSALPSYGNHPVDVGGYGFFNADNKPDTFYVDSSGKLYRADMSGSYTLILTGAKGVGGAADMDQDGDLDVIYITTTDNVALVDNAGNRVTLPILAKDMGGIGDIDKDTGYFLSGSYLSPVKDWLVPHLRCENLRTNSSLAPGTSIQAVVEVSDDNFATVKASQSVTVGSGIGVYPLSLPSARYVRVRFNLSTSSLSSTPTLNSFSLDAGIYSDNLGNYSGWFYAPSTLGTHELKVRVENAGDVGENSAAFDVRRLVFDNFRLLDNHGQLDNILNPGENYRLTVVIREDNSSTYYDVTSGTFYLRIGSNTYPLEYWENSIWRTENSFTAPTTLGSYTLQVDNIWGNSGENILGSTSATYTYQVKTIQVPIGFYKKYTGAQPWYNPGENLTISGTLTLRPDGTSVGGVTVQVYQDGELKGENQADGNGNYSFTLQAPLALGPKQVRVKTSWNGIEGDNTQTYYVKTLTLTVNLDDNQVQPGQRVCASGVATMWPEGMAIASQKVELWVGLHENFDLTKQKVGENWTNSSGFYNIYFYASQSTGTFRVLAHMKTTPEEIENENYCLMSSEALRISLNLSPEEATPGQAIEAWGSAWFEPSGAPLSNYQIKIQKWQGAGEEVVYTDSNGNWPSTGHYVFDSPSTWGRWTFRVYTDYGELHGENSRTYDTNAVEVTINFTDNTENDYNESVVNPGELVTCWGQAIVRPDNVPLTTGAVKYRLSWDNANPGYEGINENGYYSFQFNSPSSVGAYQVTIENVTGATWYMLAPSSKSLEVRALLLSEVLDKTKVDGGAEVWVTGSAVVQAAGASWPLAGKKVHVYVDNVEQLPVVYTYGNGTYSKKINAPYTSGRHEVKVQCVDENGIVGENIQDLWVERILISIQLYEGTDPSNGAVRPRQADLRVSGRAWYEYSGDPVDNLVHIYIGGNEIAQVQTDNNGNYLHTFEAPSALGTYTLKVFIQDDVFQRENSLSLYVRVLNIELNLSDDIIMANQGIGVSGRVTVAPEGWPVPGYTEVIIQSWEGTPKSVRTDSEGRFGTNLNPPGTLGLKTVTASCTDENEITGSSEKQVSVRELHYTDLTILDAHGETDGVLNPGENFRILVKIREYDGTSYYLVTSQQEANPFQVTVNSQGPYYLTYTGSEGIWRTPSFTAENFLGAVQLSLSFSGTSFNGIQGSSSQSLTYYVKRIILSLSFDNAVNPGDNVPISGTAVLAPDGLKLGNKQVDVSWGDTSTTVPTDGEGRFTYVFPAPSQLGPYTVTFRAKASGGIESENSCTIWVRTILLDLKLDKIAVTQYDNLTLTVTATLLPEEWPIPELSVRLYGTGLDNETWQATLSNGSFTYLFPVSENARRIGFGTVRAWTANQDNILGTGEITYYVGLPVQVAGALRNVENVPLRPTLRFESKTTAGCVIDVTPGASGSYSGIIIKGTYDLHIITPLFQVTLVNVRTFENPPDWALFENLISLDNFPPTAANITDVRAKLIAFAMEVSDNLAGKFEKVRITFNYSSLLDQISSEDKLVVFRSGNWDFTGRTGSFTGVGGLIDKVRHTVTLEYQGLSSYVLAETTYSFEQLSSNLQSAASSVNSAAGSLQGAAGRMEAAVGRFENVVAQMGALGEMLIPDPASLFLEVQQGENVSMRISLRNRSPADMKILPRLSGDLGGIVSVLENELPIRALESAGLNLLIAIPSSQPVGNINGSVVLDALMGKTTLTLREIPVNLKVVPAEKSLVDLRISPIQPTVRPGSTAAVSLNMLNIGKLPKVDARLVLKVIGPDGKVVLTKVENLSFETALSKVYEFKLPSNLPEADYRVEAEAEYGADGRTYSTSSVTGFELRGEAPKEISVLGMAMSSLFATLATGGLAAGAGILVYRWERSRMKVKKRFEHLVAFAELPGMEEAAWMGVLAETKRRAFFKFDDLTSHVIIAGATGSGKTIAGMDLAEEALLNKKNVIVIDPTAQWTGFLRKCKEEKMLRYFSKFGISQNQAHGFPGRIIMVEDPNMKVDVARMIRDPSGRIYIFVMEKLKPEQLDLFIQNLIQSVFDARLEESTKLRALLVFDEVHRLLPRFGGAGKGVVQLERGVREFRKWGVGIVLISQVISDFEKEIRANIRNQIQLWTRDEDELARIAEKFGAEYMRSISRAGVGHGMYFNPDYNKGKPYFINFRPILHQVGRMTVEELEKYTSASARVDAVKQKIEALEKVGVDTFDQRTELELTERKLEEGAFDMVDFYLESLEPAVERLLEKHGLKGVVEAGAPKEEAPKAEEKAPVIEEYKEALSPVLEEGRKRTSGGGRKRRSKKARR